VRVFSQYCQRTDKHKKEAVAEVSGGPSCLIFPTRIKEPSLEAFVFEQPVLLLTHPTSLIAFDFHVRESVII